MDPRLMPLAARRALALAGCRISSRAWRRLPEEARIGLMVEGTRETPSRSRVLHAMRGRLRELTLGVAATDPPADRPPEGLAQLVAGHPVLALWSHLDPLERYALVESSESRVRWRELADDIVRDVAARVSAITQRQQASAAQRAQ